MADEPVPTILLVEDNEDDVFAMRRALKKAGIANPLQVATNGRQALDYLTGTGLYANRQAHPFPFLVFLDLKLPYIDGFELLGEMRKHPDLSSLAVAVLTSSAETKDHERAYALGARTYLVKPPTPQMVQGVFDSMKSNWVAQAASPSVVSGSGSP